MKTINEIKEKRKFLKSLIENNEFSEEFIINTKTKAKIQARINILNWILNDDGVKDNEAKNKKQNL